MMMMMVLWGWIRDINIDGCWGEGSGGGDDCIYNHTEANQMKREGVKVTNFKVN